MLLSMRYKDFVWPNNPRTYTLSCRRKTAAHLVPMQGFVVQDLGRSSTVLRGEGEFFGPGAYDQYRKLLDVFEQDGAGVLIHPAWECSKALFTELKLTQEPREDYVAYSFAFCEQSPDVLTAEGNALPARTDGLQERGVYHPVGAEETAWSVARNYLLTMSEFLRLNPQISNPNDVRPGQKVRIR